MKSVANIIAEELKENKIDDLFMLTGYGAMYLNDAIEKAKINFYAARNEAAAPMMASAYAKNNNKIGAVCVTAGPGATNALPGLAEAYVDSSPIIILSGQVEKKYSSDNYNKINLRTLGIAEFSITKILKNITKYCKTIRNPYDCLYEVQKALYLCRSGRPGPVWLEIPLDVQSYIIKNPKKLKKFKIPKPEPKFNTLNTEFIIKELKNSKRPIFIIGNGIKQSQTQNEFLELAKKLSIPFFNSRFINDICSHELKNNLGLIGIKGVLYAKKIMKKSDLIISLGCRLSPSLTGGDPENFSKQKSIISINNDVNELKNPLIKFKKKINSGLKPFFDSLVKFKKKLNFNKKSWLNECNKIKQDDEIPNIYSKTKPIDMYRFLYDLCEYSNSKTILITDAGSNYYIGGQVWKFKKKQTEISSATNAAMGLSLPLSIGAAISSKNQVFSVTGDGSIELNIQELKTISHYRLNIKTFVLNNGGYVSMQKWQDEYFEKNRLDTSLKTGVGTLNFRDIAKAFSLNFLKIKNISEIKNTIMKIQKDKRPYLIEVMTDPNQRIYGQES